MFWGAHGLVNECFWSGNREKNERFCLLGHKNHDSYLVDPASNHMLVSKIKPCMSKYKPLYTGETANGSLNQL